MDVAGPAVAVVVPVAWGAIPVLVSVTGGSDGSVGSGVTVPVGSNVGVFVASAVEVGIAVCVAGVTKLVPKYWSARNIKSARCAALPIASKGKARNITL